MRTVLFFLIFSVFSMSAVSSGAGAAPLRIVALGDSLTAGYGLESGQDFAAQLQAALLAGGLEVKVENAGVSGDTSAGGLARLDWAIAGDQVPDLVIVALGGNDMLRGLKPAVTKENLAQIIQALQKKKIRILLAGMRSPTNMGAVFQTEFDKIYPELATEYDVALYPFFLEGVVMKAALNLPDGMHPNQEGVKIMVQKISVAVKDMLIQ